MSKELYFNFRIVKKNEEKGIDLNDIDETLKTPMSSLDPADQAVYMQVHNALSVMESLKNRRQVAIELKRRKKETPLRKLIAVFGMIL